MKHFETLWTECESYHKDNQTTNSNPDSIVDELLMKLKLYKVISSKYEIPETDLKGLKSRALGEVMLAITNLSLVEDINVYDSLQAALQQRNAINLDKKYADLIQSAKI
jgi:hypothetical protein